MKKPTPEEYLERKMTVALGFAPRIYPCQKCGNPVVTGYICDWCLDRIENLAKRKKDNA